MWPCGKSFKITFYEKKENGHLKGLTGYIMRFNAYYIKSFF